MAENEIGKVIHYYSKIGVGIIRLSGALKVGDVIHFKGGGTDFTQTVKSMQIEHASIEEAKAGQEIGIKTESAVKDNAVVYLIIE